MKKMINNCLIEFNEVRYNFYSYMWDGKLRVLINDKDSLNPILKGIQPIILKEFLEAEFLVLWDCDNNEFKFQHLSFDKKNKKVTTKFEKKYKALNKDDAIMFKKDLVMLNGINENTIYNYKNSKNVELDKFDVVTLDGADENGLIGKVNFGDYESIMFNIDGETLEIDNIYSVMQEKFIPVIKDKNLNLNMRLFVTLENEIFSYLENVKQLQKQLYDTRLDNACKKLVKKNEYYDDYE